MYRIRNKRQVNPYVAGWCLCTTGPILLHVPEMNFVADGSEEVLLLHPRVYKVNLQFIWGPGVKRF